MDNIGELVGVGYHHKTYCDGHTHYQTKKYSKRILCSFPCDCIKEIDNVEEEIR